MGLFKRKDADIEWLEKADKAYVSALRTNNAGLLEKYFSRECLSRVVEVVTSNRDNLCGLERYRVVTYTLQKRTDTDVVYLKSITYKNVNMGYGVVVPMGEAGDELWHLRPINGTYVVTSIRGA